MISGKAVRIVSLGKYLPQRVTSSELEDKYGLPAGWSERYSGVAERHYATHESNGFMGARAIEEALEKAGLTLHDIDMIISAAATYDYPIPNSASIIKSELLNGHEFSMPAVDVDSTCLSFVNAFDIASSLLDNKRYRRIIIVSSEIASIGLNPENREVLTLFGDGAAAAILEYDENSESAFIKGAHFNFCEGVYDTIIKGSGSRNWHHSYDRQLHSFEMKGRNLLRLAKLKIPEFISSFFEDLEMELTDVKVIIPHQASRVGLQLFKRQFGFADNQVKESLSRYGNCIGASIPLTLCDCIENGELKRGDTCMLLGTSAGFSIGGVLFKF